MPAKKSAPTPAVVVAKASTFVAQKDGSERFIGAGVEYDAADVAGLPAELFEPKG